MSTVRETQQQTASEGSSVIGNFLWHRIYLRNKNWSSVWEPNRVENMNCHHKDTQKDKGIKDK